MTERTILPFRQSAPVSDPLTRLDWQKRRQRAISIFYRIECGPVSGLYGAVSMTAGINGFCHASVRPIIISCAALAPSTPLLGSGGGHRLAPRGFPLRDHGPDDPGHLVGQSGCLGVAKRMAAVARTTSKLCSLADAPHALLAAGCMVFEGQPQPSGKMAPRGKVLGLDAQSRGASDHWAKSGDFRQHLAYGIVGLCIREFGIQQRQTTIQIVDMLAHRCKYILCRSRDGCVAR